jgi:hypothetical protein
MRRSVSMSRPCGRFAVGRYPSLDTNTELRRTQRPSKKIEKQEDRKTSKPWVTGGLDIEVATDKQGSTLVRWAAVEAVQRVSKHTQVGQIRDQVGSRRGRNIGVVAAARELLTLVFYGLREGISVACSRPAHDLPTTAVGRGSCTS